MSHAFASGFRGYDRQRNEHEFDSGRKTQAVDMAHDAGRSAIHAAQNPAETGNHVAKWDVVVELLGPAAGVAEAANNFRQGNYQQGVKDVFGVAIGVGANALNVVAPFAGTAACQIATRVVNHGVTRAAE